jgi:hypothetical protein
MLATLSAPRELQLLDLELLVPETSDLESIELTKLSLLLLLSGC